MEHLLAWYGSSPPLYSNRPVFYHAPFLPFAGRPAGRRGPGLRYLSSVLFFAPRSRIETDPFCLKVVNNKLSPRCYFRDFISPQFYPKGFEELRFPGVPQAVRPSSRNFSGKAECRDHNLMRRIKVFWGTIESDLTLWQERLYPGRPPAL